MDTNQNQPAFTNVNNNTPWNINLENMAPAWPITYPLQIPSSSSSSSPSFLMSDMFGISLEQEDHEGDHEEEEEELGAMKEMMYKIAAMQPVDIDPATIRKPKRRNVRISDDPQSVAARHRRERISEKIRILQRLVPGGTKLDTASMLDEAIRYVKFLKRQIRLLQSPQLQQCNNFNGIGTSTTATTLGVINNSATSDYWPSAPNILPTSTTTTTAGGMGFNAGDSSSGFNHEVISEYN